MLKKRWSGLWMSFRCNESPWNCVLDLQKEGIAYIIKSMRATARSAVLSGGCPNLEWTCSSLEDIGLEVGFLRKSEQCPRENFCN